MRISLAGFTTVLFLPELTRNSRSTPTSTNPKRLSFKRERSSPAKMFQVIFGRTLIEKDKTELIAMVTPRVVFDEADARAVTDLYNERLQSIQSLLKKHKAGRR